MEHIYKFRIFPSYAQEAQIQDTFSCCGYVYNDIIRWQLEHEDPAERMDGVQAVEQLDGLVAQTAWLQRADPTALRSAVIRAVTDFEIYEQLRRRNPDAPVPFCASDDPHKMYACTVGDGLVEIGDGQIRLPFLGDVACTVTQTGPVHIVAASVLRGGSGCYQVVVRCVGQHDLLRAEKKTAGTMGLSISYFDPVDYADGLRRRRAGKPAAGYEHGRRA